MKDDTILSISQINEKNGLVFYFKVKKTLLFSLFLLFFMVSMSVLFSTCAANPIPVYPETTPSFEPAAAINDVQQPGFVIWLILVSFLDFAANILFLYAGLVLLVMVKLQKEPWFTRISRYRLISGVLLLSTFGILSEWLLGSSIGSLLFIAAIVFIVTFLIGMKWFDLRFVASSFLAGYMVLANVISWIIIFSFL